MGYLLRIGELATKVAYGWKDELSDMEKANFCS